MCRERMGHLSSEHRCQLSEAVSFLLLHIKGTNTVLEGAGRSSRQEDLGNE